jgi:hypothetical protein
MNNIHQTIWRKLSSGQKVNFLGAVLLMISLFLSWYSDKDIFRSGDSYTALNGPLYFVGFSILALCLANLGTLIYSVWKGGVSKRWGESGLGKNQMMMGFASMYLLIVINSVYFHPQFGLNILSKKSEIGVMLALVATVMICIGGYLSFRKKFELEELSTGKVVAGVASIAPVIADVVSEKSPAVAEIPVSPVSENRPVIAPSFPKPALQPQAVQQSVQTQPVAPAAPAINSFSERSPLGKTDYERSKLYENLKKTMIRDTLTPDKRRKLREKEAKENAFSANFGKTEKIATASAAPKPAASVEALLRKASGEKAAAAGANSEGGKKPQMYRMDL